MDKDKEQALYDFWSRFGLPAYEENSVPDDAVFPYIAFEVSTGGIGAIIPIAASIWDKTAKGTAFIDRKADEILQYIKNMRDCPVVNGGRYRVFTDGVSAQTMGDPEDKLIKRKYLNVYFEFLTNY